MYYRSIYPESCPRPLQLRPSLYSQYRLGPCHREVDTPCLNRNTGLMAQAGKGVTCPQTMFPSAFRHGQLLTSAHTLAYPFIAGCGLLNKHRSPFFPGPCLGVSHIRSGSHSCGPLRRLWKLGPCLQELDFTPLPADIARAPCFPRQMLHTGPLSVPVPLTHMLAAPSTFPRTACIIIVSSRSVVGCFLSTYYGSMLSLAFQPKHLAWSWLLVGQLFSVGLLQ